MNAARPLAALAPREIPLPLARERSVALLEAHLDMVAALCERAIAVAWDSGRIAFADAGPHPFASEVSGIVGHTHGLAAAEAQAATARLSAVRARLRATPPADNRAHPLGQIVLELGLSKLAIRILLVVGAPALRPELARLYGIISNDAERPLCDELLVYELLRGETVSRHEVTRELAPASPLVRFGMVRVREHPGRPRAFAELTADATILSRLRGDPPEALAPGATRRVLGGRPLAELLLPAGLPETMLEELSRLQRPARLVLRGRVGSGRSTTLAALAKLTGRWLGLVDAGLLPRERGAFHHGLAREIERVFLLGGLPAVTGLDSGAAEDEVLRAVFRAAPFPIGFRLAHDASPPLDPGALVYDLPPLEEGARLEFLGDALRRHGLEVDDTAAIAARYRAGPGVLESAVAQAAAWRGGAAGDAAGDVDRAMRQHIEARIGRVAQRVTRLASWNGVVLPADVEDSVRELIGRVRHRRIVMEEWGFGRVLTSTRGLTTLFQGAPGTGKTLVAGLIARELGLDLYRIDLAQTLSKWVGETEKNLAEAFDAAEDGRVILLFDEADSLFAKRGDVKSAQDRYANLEVNYLLQRLDSFEGIAILTTNLAGSIDPAFMRRLTVRLVFPFPDEDMREKLWRSHLPAEAPIRGALDFAGLARRYKLSGGYIRNAVLRAAYLAAQEGGAIAHEHLERAVELEYREVGKLSSSGALE